ncbi:MAG: DUF3179 domain-containing (seleno)protein [Bryobacter sp.]|nr:DUF3179 domain-containing (seleno)protein [Bryobacter sp.]
MANDTVGGQSGGGQNICLVYCTLCGTVIPYFAGKHQFGTSGLLYESSKLMFDATTKSLWSTLQGQPLIGPLANSGIQLRFANLVTTTWKEWREAHPHTTVLSLETGHRRDYGEGFASRNYFANDELIFEVSRPDRHLRKHPRLELQHAGQTIVVETSPAGMQIVKVNGETYPAHRAFWFGWITQFPDTVLIR